MNLTNENDAEQFMEVVKKRTKDKYPLAHSAIKWDIIGYRRWYAVVVIDSGRSDYCRRQIINEDILESYLAESYAEGLLEYVEKNAHYIFSNREKIKTSDYACMKYIYIAKYLPIFNRNHCNDTIHIQYGPDCGKTIVIGKWLVWRFDKLFGKLEKKYIEEHMRILPIPVALEILKFMMW
jgi:hypothetical protein